MNAFLLVVVLALCCASAQASVLTDAISFVNPTVVDDWSMLGGVNGEDGPLYIQGLRIESLNNRPEYTEIGNYIADPRTGFPDDADGYVSALLANTVQTDFLFTFPGEVIRAGLYFRGSTDIEVQALDSSRNVLAIAPTFNNLVQFYGFADLPGLRSIRISELSSDFYSTQFDEVQWQLVPEPSIGAFFLCYVLLAAGRRKR